LPAAPAFFHPASPLHLIPLRLYQCRYVSKQRWATVGQSQITLNLQELAFFSWFFTSKSIGIHGWFSDNDTFTTDAGPVCVPMSSGTGQSSPVRIIGQN
jgi:hypothetical protein